MEVSTLSSFEPSWFDGRRPDVPRWRKLFVQGFGEPLQSFYRQDDELRYVAIGKRLTKLSSAVKGKAEVSVVSTSPANVEDIPAVVGGTILSKELGTTLITVERCDVKQAYLQRYLHRPQNKTSSCSRASWSGRPSASPNKP